MAKSDPRKATRYLNNFAGLIRRILNSSQEGTISFSDELETIRIYLSLEQERFQVPFDYSINWNAQVAADTLLVPALFLHAYVEHAMIQMLGLRRGSGRVNLEVMDTVAHLKIEIKVDAPAISGEQRPVLGDGQTDKQTDLSLALKRLQQFWGP